jgi:hypothetical protein
VPRNARQLHQGIEASKRVEITPADADMADGNTDIAFPKLRASDIGKTADAFTFDQQGFHVTKPFLDWGVNRTLAPGLLNIDQFRAAMSTGRSNRLQGNFALAHADGVQE